MVVVAFAAPDITVTGGGVLPMVRQPPFPYRRPRSRLDLHCGRGNFYHGRGDGAGRRRARCGRRDHRRGQHGRRTEIWRAGSQLVRVLWQRCPWSLVIAPSMPRSAIGGPCERGFGWVDSACGVVATRRRLARRGYRSGHCGLCDFWRPCRYRASFDVGRYAGHGSWLYGNCACACACGRWLLILGPRVSIYQPERGDSSPGISCPSSDSSTYYGNSPGSQRGRNDTYRCRGFCSHGR